MDIIISIIIFIVGIIIGIFVQKNLSSTATQASDAEQKLSQREQELTQYKLDVATHLDDSAALLKKMNETCQIAMAQMEKSTALLQQATPTLAKEDLPFFSQETTAELEQTAELRNQSHKNRASDDEISEPPRDYSNDRSGLFSDEKQSVTNS